MIVGNNVKIAAARFIKAIGREAPGGPVAKYFQARVDRNAHEGLKNMIKTCPLEMVHYLSKQHAERLKDNCEHVQGIADQCVKLYEAEEKTLKVDRPNEKKMMDGRDNF